MRERRESGFALLLVFALAAAIALTLYLELPRAVFEAERAKEQLLIDRGEQYKRAVQLYYRRFGRFPATIDQLENTNNIRFLRRKYKDPMTGKDEWRIIHAGPGGMPSDSVTMKPPKDPNAPGTPMGSSDTTASSDAGPQATPRYMMQRGGGAVPGDQQPVLPSNSEESNPPYPQPPVYQPGQPVIPGQPVVPGQPPIPGQPTVPGQPAVPGQPNVPGQPPGFQPGQPVNPDQPQPQGQPYNPTQPQQGQPYNPIQPQQGQPYNPMQPQGQPYNPMQPQQGQPYPQAQPYSPQGQPQPYTPSAPVTNQNAPAGPSQVPQQIRDMLFNPGTQRPGFGSNAMTVGGGILGVASTADGEGIKVYKNSTKFGEWEFYYDLRQDIAAGAVMGGVGFQPQGQPQGQPQPQPQPAKP